MRALRFSARLGHNLQGPGNVVLQVPYTENIQQGKQLILSHFKVVMENCRFHVVAADVGGF